MNESSDKRDQPRVRVEAFVKVLGAGPREYVFRTRDVSKNGLFLYTKVGHIYPIKKGTELQIEIYDYDRPIIARGVVARVVQAGDGEPSEYSSGFGVRILEMDETSQDHLDAFVDRAGKGEIPY